MSKSRSHTKSPEELANDFAMRVVQEPKEPTPESKLQTERLRDLAASWYLCGYNDACGAWPRGD